MTFKYGIVLYWSRIDGVFVAEVPELPGCVAHGDTQRAALDNVNRAMALRIDTAEEFGDPVPERAGERLTLGQRIRPEVGANQSLSVLSVQNGAEPGSRIAARPTR